MSKLSETIESVEAVRVHNKSAMSQIQVAITSSEEGAVQASALGAQELAAAFSEAKKQLEILAQTVQGLDGQIDAAVATLTAGAG